MLVVLVCLGSFVWAGGSSEQATQRTKISITFATGDTTTKEAIQDIVEAFNASQSKYQLQPNLSISTGAYLDS
jgi:ABC-type glycerol-3-phosphate transport system substrate-binding protein